MADGTKKSFTPALLSLAEGGGTHDPYLVAVLLSKKLNMACGGTVVTPWEVGRIPLEWIEAVTALVDRLPGMAEGQKKVEDYLAKWRKKLDGK